jgi:hypothetical protein
MDSMSEKNDLWLWKCYLVNNLDQDLTESELELLDALQRLQLD